MFLNYDGAGGRFGDTGLEATTSNAQASSVYASRDALGRTVIVAINKARTAKRAAIVVQGASGVNKAAVWALTGASALPVRQPDVPFSTSTSLTYTMPAMSVTTLVLTP
jgi:O-glycosyl hydrolase